MMRKGSSLSFLATIVVVACICSLVVVICGQRDTSPRVGTSLIRANGLRQNPCTTAPRFQSLNFATPRGVFHPRASMDDENREAYKQVVMEYVKDGIASESVGAWRNDINEMLYRLEPLNPTEEPAYSKLLQGEWEFKFAGSMGQGILASPTREIALLLYAGGYTPGRFGLDVASRLPNNVIDVKSVTLSVTDRAPTGKITAKLGLPGNREVELGLTTNLEPESDFTMSETYQGLSAVGRSFELPSQLQSKRRFYIRYLDDDLMVVRDDTGVADVLVKKPIETIPVEPADAAATTPEEPAKDTMMTFDTEATAAASTDKKEEEGSE